MAEKIQKRILIKEYDLGCDLADCQYCEEQAWCSEKDGMTRQEAIERINHAICVEVHGNCDKCDKEKYNLGYPCNDYKRYAEAALNALLEK